MKSIKIFIFIVIYSQLITAQDIITEEILLKNGEIELPGTLSYKQIEKNTPLVIFVSGSGNPDRNGNQPKANVNANYIKQLSGLLNEQGIAFYRYDKRSATVKNLSSMIKNMRFEYLVDDVGVILNHFKSENRFKKIILIGHSQGSLVSMLAIQNNDSVDKYISLAGLGSTMEEAIIRQISNQSKEFGELTAAHFKELKETDTIQEVNPLLASIFTPINHPFIKSYNAYNPIEEITKIKIPTLIINGDSDLQVQVEDAKALQNAKTDAKLLIIPKMNHVLKEINNLQENQASYASKEYPISSHLITSLIEFIKK